MKYSVEPTELLYMFGRPIEQRIDDHEWCSTYYCYPEHVLRFLALLANRDKRSLRYFEARCCESAIWRRDP